MTDLLQHQIAPGAKLTLGGQDYTLTFPIKSVIAYENKTGESLYEIANWAHIDPRKNSAFFLAAIWAALQQHHSDMTYEKLSEIVDFTNSVAVEAALVATLKSYFPKPKPDDTEGTTDPNAQTPESVSANSSASSGR